MLTTRFLVCSATLALLASFVLAQSPQTPNAKAPPPHAKYQTQGTAKDKTDREIVANKARASLSPAVDAYPKENAPDANRKNDERLSEFFNVKITDVVIAAFTVVIAVVTAILAIYTAKLFSATNTLSEDARGTSERQAREMTESLRIAGVAADAATKAAEATEKQAATIVSLERPIVVVEELELITRPIPEFIRQLSGGASFRRVNESYDVYCSFTNYGRTPAEIRSISWNWTIANSIPPEPIYVNRIERGAGFETVIKPGGLRREKLTAAFDFSITPEQRALIDERKVYVWIWLRLLCADFFGGIADVGYACFHWPAAKSEGLELLPAQFVIAQNQPLYAYRKYYADGVIPEQPPATGLS